MNSQKTKLVKILSVVCVLLMVAMFVLQFIPFWSIPGETAEDDISLSISEYVWFPTENGDLTDYLEDEIDDYTVNSIVLPCVVLLVAPFLTAVIFLINKDNLVVPALTAIAGIIGVWGFLAKPALQYGSIWPVYLVLSILMIAAGAGEIFIKVKK